MSFRKNTGNLKLITSFKETSKYKYKTPLQD